jgi:hypothetical protein
MMVFILAGMSVKHPKAAPLVPVGSSLVISARDPEGSSKKVCACQL